MTQPSDGVSANTPVYVPWATLISALDTLKQNGIPASGKIDKSIWDSQSGTVQAQLLLGFKFLGLIDDQKKVLPSLPPLVAAEDRKPLLKKIVEEKYKSIIAQDLTTITPNQFDDAFRKMGVTGSTLDRAVRFFVKACSQLEIPIAKRFSERSKTPSTPRKKRAANGAKRDDEAASNSSTKDPLTAKIQTWEEQLLGKFPQFDPSWPDALKTQWFDGFSKLMKTKPE